MTTQLEKLKALRDKTDPNSALLSALNTLMGSIQTLKGEKGDTPIKGKDYFTEAELGGIIAYIQSNIRVPLDGKDGKDGAQGAVGPRGVQGPKGEKGDPGTQGLTGEKGEKGDSATFDKAAIIDEIISMVYSAQQWRDMEKTVKYNKFDQRWKGGGGTQSATAAQIYTQTPTGAIDGVNTAYTTAHAITTVIGMWYNGEFIHPSEYTPSGSGFTMATALPVISGGAFTISYT